jgi:hypothetical protein
VTERAKLLVSLCNLDRWADQVEQPQYLALVDPAGGTATPVCPELREIEDGVGVTGVCRHDGGFACIVQTAPRSTLCLLDADFRLLEAHRMRLGTGAHSLLSRDSMLYVVSTANDTVVRVDPSGAEEVVWRYSDAEYAAHMNSIVDHRGALLISGFGAIARREDTRGRGIVADISSGETVLEGLNQPHSLISLGDRFLLCDSETSVVLDSQGQRLELDHTYLRGLAVDGDTLYVGSSMSRNLGEWPGQPGAGERTKQMSCGVLVLSPGSPLGQARVEGLIDLRRYAAEVYDVLVL